MSLLVIAVLAVIWVVCLTPMMLRKLSERRFTNSVDSFHRQLRGLRRAYPRLAASAADPGTALYMTEASGRDPRTYGSSSSVSAHRNHDIEAPTQRVSPQAARRRRVLGLLVVATLGFFVLGLVPALRVLWGLSLLAFAATAGYVALLIYVHRRAVERRVKVIDIRDLHRGTDSAWPKAPVSSRARYSDEADWREDELLDADYDYDEIMAGGR